MRAVFIVGVLGLFLAPLAFAQHETGADLFSGEQAFQNICANCHGRAGNQIANVDLGHGVFRKPYDNEQLLGIVMNGLPGTAMPATPGMSRAQAEQIVIYLRSRANAADPGAGGDVDRGRALFLGKGDCMTCHRVNGSGSRRGPDLSRIGLMRTSAQLAGSLREPDAEVQPVNRSYAVTLRDGRRISGRLLNQDAYTVQLLDDDERLRSFVKADLRGAEFISSPMPSTRDRFNDGETADLVRYLGSLRGTVRP
ncbi:MAG: c-type cytochrome [Steroidobacteraceae bacterium]